MAGTNSTDVLIVGAGIIGLAHATLAVSRGLSVRVIDRDHRAVGASVRNFGHCCVTAQSGELLELAQLARTHWLQTAASAEFWSSQAGAVVVARSATEMAVLTELSESREAGQVQLLTPRETCDRVHSGNDDVVGGAWLRDDLRVDPRTTVGTIAAWLEEHPDVQIDWNTSALGVESGTVRRNAVRTSRSVVEADHVLFCVGHDVDYLFPDVAEAHNLRRCSLQMASAHSPHRKTIEPAVLSGTSMLRYPAFTEMPSAAKLREEIEHRNPSLIDVGANVMFTQRPDGTLLLGDSHDYDLSTEPFLFESTDATLLAEHRDLLGVDSLDVFARWQGVYASSEQGPLLEKEIADGVHVISVTSGVGMTISFGLAEKTINHLTSPVPA